MTIAQEIGQSGRVAIYTVPDDELAVGSTLGGPTVATVIKANGSIEKVFSIEAGECLFSTMILRHYDARTGMYLAQDHIGHFSIHPEHQEHHYTLNNGLAVREDIFVLSGPPGEDGTVDPPGVYETVELHNPTGEPLEVVTYAYAVLRGTTPHDVVAEFDRNLKALIVCNRSQPDLVRIFGCNEAPESYETTLDYAKAVAESCPGKLSGHTDAPFDPLGVLQHRHVIRPGERCRFWYLLSCGPGRQAAAKNYRACPPADEARERTIDHYRRILDRAFVLTPDPYVNNGVLWSKANMLRIETKAPTGWCFTNDPTRSSNSVARDTAWFGFGADYVTPEFARDSLLAFVRLQEKSGLIVEYYDIRTKRTADYGLNINDNTPLIIMALWHHFNVTGDKEFLRSVYRAATKAAQYILSQRNEHGLVWCTATGTGNEGIVGWRNVISDYRLSGATTEVNSECYSALMTVCHMARVLGKHDEGDMYLREAEALKQAINEHLFDERDGLYYLHIDLDHHPRSDITSDLVFPVMFGVASEERSAHIIGRLSNVDFWTSVGMRTTPRDAPNYTPSGGWGLLGGVWVAVSFWYAFAAAPYSSTFMAEALSRSFRNYSSDPKGNNTVPGQFSEWLNGETLVNEGMMLSPWFPPRYLWAAIEGVAGFAVEDGMVKVSPRLAPDWKWLAVQNLMCRNESYTFFAARMPDVRIYTNFISPGEATGYVSYDQDISSAVRATGNSVCTIGLRHGSNLILFAGNTDDRTITTSLQTELSLSGRYRLRTYNSLLGRWNDEDGLLSPKDIERGITTKLERKGFCVLELRQEV